MNYKYRLSHFPPIVAALLCCFLSLNLVLVSCRPSSQDSYQRNRFRMGTLITITVVCQSQKKAMHAIDKAFTIISDIENQTSAHLPQSYTSLINETAGKKNISVSADFLLVIQKSLEYSQLTNGAFDITIGPITALWRFDDDQGMLPSSEKINKKLPLVGYQGIYYDKVNGLVGLKMPGSGMDLGGIAKGYAVDQAVKVLQQEGIKAGIVNAGGDLRLFGHKTEKEKNWHIGIQHPRKPEGILLSLKITDKSIVTSGDYERFFLKDGIRYHHIIDPKTGRPPHNCQGVTILAESTLAADALATAVFILGPDKGMKLIETLPKVEGIIVDNQGEVTLSSGLPSKVIWREDNH